MGTRTLEGYTRSRRLACRRLKNMPKLEYEKSAREDPTEREPAPAPTEPATDFQCSSQE